VYRWQRERRRHGQAEGAPACATEREGAWHTVAGGGVNSIAPQAEEMAASRCRRRGADRRSPSQRRRLGGRVDEAVRAPG
jgi:hypothetical protein